MILACVKAFLVGGLLCAVGQLLIDRTKLTPARILVGYAVTGVVLGGIGVYEPLVEFAGAGASVPLTGFGAMMARQMRQEIAERGLYGILTGALSAGSAGITTAMLMGLLVSATCRSGEKSAEKQGKTAAESEKKN